VLFDTWIRDPEWVKNQDPDPQHCRNVSFFLLFLTGFIPLRFRREVRKLKAEEKKCSNIIDIMRLRYMIPLVL
jgi:hypothetical protein